MAETAETSNKKVVTLKTSDGETFEVEEVAALLSSTIKHMIEDGCADNAIPLPNVTGPIMSKVIEYLKKHAGEDTDKIKAENNAWDDEFVKGVDENTLFELVMAANYLDIKGLLNVTCQSVADRIKDMPVEQVREVFNIENDFTPEEEAKIREENKWAFE